MANFERVPTKIHSLKLFWYLSIGLGEESVKGELTDDDDDDGPRVIQLA